MRLKSWKSILVIVFCAFILLAAGLFFARPLYLPDSFIIAQIEKKLTAAGYPLKIESAEIDFLHQISLKGLTLCDPTGLDFLKIKEARLTYHPTALFHHVFFIDELTLIGLEYKFFSDARIPADTTGAESASGFDWSYALEIQKARVEKGAYLISQILSDGSRMQYRGADVTLDCKNFRLKSSTDFHAEGNVRQEDTLFFSYQSNDFDTYLSAPIDLLLDALIDDNGNTVQLSSRLTPTFGISFPDSSHCSYILPHSELSCSIIIKPNWDIFIDSIQAGMSEALIIQANSRIEDTWGGGHLFLDVQHGELNLATLWEILRQPTTLPMVGEGLKGRNLTGWLSLDSSVYKYNLWSLTADYQTRLKFTLQDLNFTDNSFGYVLSNVNSSGSFEATVQPEVGFSYNAEAEIGIGSIRYDLSDFKDAVISPLNLTLETGSQPKWKDMYLKASWKGNGPYDGKQIGNLSLRADSLNFDDPANSPGLLIEGSLELAEAPLDSTFPGVVSGMVTTNLEISTDNIYGADLKTRLFGPDIKIKHETKNVFLPPIEINSSGKLSMAEDFQTFNLKQGNIEALPFGSMNGDATFGLDQSWSVDRSQMHLNLDALYNVLRPFLPDTLNHLRIQGIMRAEGRASGAFNDSSFALAPNLKFKIEDASLESPEFGFKTSGVNGSGSLTGELNDLRTDVKVTLGEIDLPAFASLPYRKLQGQLRARVKDLNKIDSLQVDFKSAELGVECHLDGKFNLFPIPAGQGRVQLAFAQADSVEPLDKLWIKGKADSDFSLILDPDSSVHLSGTINIDDFALNYADSLFCEGLSANLPLQMDLRMDSLMTFAQGASGDRATLQDPVFFATFEHLYPPNSEGGSVTCRKIRFTNYELTDLSGRITQQQGAFSLPQFTIQCYGGTLQGGLVLNANALTPDSIQYNLRISADGVDLAQLPGVRSGKGEDTRISAYAHFKGQGINTAGNFNLEGALDITRIGRQVADNLLKFLDPEETDPSIQTYRGYLKRGWGVKVFSFAVKDDFVYASITPSKPPLTKPDMFIVSRLIGLGKSISFGRVPLKFFLTATPEAQQQ
ncbi:MAG: hypothetical protein NTW14_04225 [bacterium]|nr:hypothetical protein [bacterium]